MAEWSHLPNAEHIDRVLTSLKQRPEAWSAAQGAAWGAAWSAAQDAARNAAWDAARNAARNAASALIAYDDCAYLLDQTPDVVRAHIKLTNDPAAILLLVAAIVFQGESNGLPI